VLIAGVLAACAVEPIGEGEGVGDGIAEPAAVPKRSSNSLAENAIARYAADLNQLVAAPLADGALVRRIAVDEAGVQLLSYSARCMLAPGATIGIATYRGPLAIPLPAASQIQWPSLGLAPAWKTRALTEDERRWLMGCLLAHINAAGRTVDISLRGYHAALATTIDERADFQYLEGAFYGRFGDPADADEAAMTHQYACYGPALAKCGGAAPALLYDRLCTLGGCEHLQVVGPCERPTGPKACKARAGDAYPECYASAALGPLGETFKAGVITTYLPDFTCPQ
jgi:hypothetical protein